MNLGDFPTPARYDRYGAATLPSGVVRLTNLSPNFRGDTDYLYPTAGGVRTGRGVWNPGTGGYVDRLSGVPLASMGQDRASVLASVMGQFQGAQDAGPAFYGDSYGGVQAAAATARARAQAYDLAQQKAAEDAAEFNARLADAAEGRRFDAAQSAANRANSQIVARIQASGRGGGGGYGSFAPDSSAAPAVSPADVGPAVTGQPYLNRDQTPYYRRGVGYVRDFIVPTTAGNRAVANDRIDELMEGVQDEADYGPPRSTRSGGATRRMSADEQNLWDEPVNAAKFDAELTPALARRKALETGQENNTQAKEAIDSRLAEYEKEGSIKLDKDLKTYVPTSPTARGAAILPQLLKDKDSVDKTLADIKDKLAEANAQVNEVTAAHSKTGLRYKEPPVAVRAGEQTGPGFIIGRQGARPLNVPAPVQPIPKADPVVTSFRTYKQRQAKKAALQDELKQAQAVALEDIRVREYGAPVLNHSGSWF